MEKPEKILFNGSIIFFILEAKSIFTNKKLVKSHENPWSTVLNSIDFRIKKYFYHVKK
jgi:hypothetical protein